MWLPTNPESSEQRRPRGCGDSSKPSSPTCAASVYVNFLDADEGTARVREAYGDGTYQRLTDVKAKYDPDNAFHINQNIRPE